MTTPAITVEGLWKSFRLYHERNRYLKAAMLGNHFAWPMEKGKFKFGTWQTVYFAEFDGPRSRKIWVGFQPVAG
ncbi:MAG: hypothetical protein EBY86_08470 [Acidimicrobiia bacterium]|nr:hypothetical protein [Acidimicrobiia bacterium]